MEQTYQQGIQAGGVVGYIGRPVLDVLPLDDIHLDWEHIYLLAWHSPNGRPYLSTGEDGPQSRYIRVVVTGPVLPFGPPMWDAPAQHKGALWLPPAHPCQGFTLHLLGQGENGKARVLALGGVYAYGWYFPEGFQRGWHREDCGRLHRLGERPCWRQEP